MPTELINPTGSRLVFGLAVACLGAASSGCPVPEPTPDPPDAMRIPRDVGPVDAFVPPPPDAWFPDIGPVPDAFDPTDSAVRDAGRDAGSSSVVVVDGRLTERLWDTAPTRTTDEALTGPFDGTVISRFQYVRTEDELAIAIAGTFPVETSVITIYIDLDYPNATDGVVLSSAGLGDRMGQVDSVLSNVLMGTDATFRPELGWGAGRRPEAITTGNATVGWRVLRQTEPHALVALQRSACSLEACETTLDLEALGIAGTTPLGLVLRVGDSALLDAWAPLQSIPFDPDPEFVSIVETIPAAE